MGMNNSAHIRISGRLSLMERPLIFEGAVTWLCMFHHQMIKSPFFSARLHTNQLACGPGQKGEGGNLMLAHVPVTPIGHKATWQKPKMIDRLINHVTIAGQDT